VLVCTEISLPGNDSYRLAFNDSIWKHWTEFADGVIDLAGKSELSDCTNTTYFQGVPDQIHLTNAGYQIVAATVSANVNDFIEEDGRSVNGPLKIIPSSYSTTAIQVLNADEEQQFVVDTSGVTNIYGDKATGSINTQALFKLRRPVNTGVSFPQAAEFRLGQWKASGGSVYEPYTSLELYLKADDATNDYECDNLVMTFQNDKKIIFETLKLTGGSPGAGKILTSDADGDATWATAPSSMTWPAAAGIAVYSGSSSWGTSITDNHLNWDKYNQWDGGTGAWFNATNGRSALGLGTAATANLGTGGSDAAYGNHNHSGVYAAVDQTMYIGTTGVAINRGSAALTLDGITLNEPVINTSMAFCGANGSNANFRFQKETVDATHAGYYFSHRDNNMDFKLYGYDGPVAGNFKDFLTIDWDGPITYGAHTYHKFQKYDGTLQLETDADGLNIPAGKVYQINGTNGITGSYTNPTITFAGGIVIDAENGEVDYKSIVIQVFGPTELITAGTGVGMVSIPNNLNGWTINSVEAHAYDGTGGQVELNLTNSNGSEIYPPAQGVLSTKVFIDDGELDSINASSRSVVSYNTIVYEGYTLGVNIDAIGGGARKGLDVRITFVK
jgi:hypothetical protein